mgnify:CR=1 FL=1
MKKITITIPSIIDNIRIVESFIDNAKEESINTILDQARRKSNGEIEKGKSIKVSIVF